MRSTRFHVAVCAVLMLAMLAVFASLLGGCTAQQVAQYQQDKAKLVDNARATVDAAQAEVDAAQKRLDQLHAKLSALPPDSPDRKAIEDALPEAEKIFDRAQLYLSLAQMGLDVISTPAPTTQPAPTPTPGQ